MTTRPCPPVGGPNQKDVDIISDLRSLLKTGQVPLHGISICPDEVNKLWRKFVVWGVYLRKTRGKNAGLFEECLAVLNNSPTPSLLT